MTNKATRDARVAEVVGYTLWKWVGFYKTQSIFPPGLDPAVEYQKSEYEKIDWDNHNGDYCTNKVRPFISAPTYETDGIVLEWVQGQDNSVYGKFSISLSGAILQRISKVDREIMSMGLYDVIWLKYYKPGDYAHALLVVKEERGD